MSYLSCEDQATCTDASLATKRDKPEGPYEHRAIRDVIVKSIFTATRGMQSLADTFNEPDDDAFNPVPISTIALAATVVKFLKTMCVILSSH